MAGVGKSLTDEVYLKIAEEEEKRRQHRYQAHRYQDGKRNSNYFTESKSVNQLMNKDHQKSKSKFDVKIQKSTSNLSLNDSGFPTEIRHLRNDSSSRQSCSYERSDNPVNNKASTSMRHLSKSTTNLYQEASTFSKTGKKHFYETQKEKYSYQHSKEKLPARNRSLNRQQISQMDTRISEMDNFDRTKPFHHSQSSRGQKRGQCNPSQFERAGEHPGHFVKHLGYKRLQDLCNYSPADIITFLMKSNSGFQELLSSNLRPDLLILTLRVLAKACTCDFVDNKGALLSDTCQSSLLDSIENHILRMATDDSDERKQTMGSFIFDLLLFYETVMKMLPNTASERFNKLFRHTEIMLNAVENYHAINLSEQKEQFNMLNKQLQNMIEERKSKKLAICSKDELLNYSKPPDNFRDKSVYPTQEDLFGDRKPFLRSNITNGAYLNVEHYLDVQFRLLREDFVSPLREGLAKYLDDTIDSKKRHRIDNIRIYRNVRFGDPKVINDVIGIVVHFDLKEKLNIKWEYSKRFMFGSLLLFTNNNFKQVIFGTILDRNIENLKKGQIIVDLDVRSKKLNVFESDFLMVESEVYFEPYKHVMKALQKFDDSSFPMKDYIIYVQKECPPPKYVMEHPQSIYDIDSMQIEVLNNNSWPSEDELNLDKSQFAAFKAALTEEFVIIQGPPGTGKTYLGLKIAKVLLQNTDMWNVGHSPIFVVCYTNHALDQFLEGLLSSTKEIVRVGGQSKSDALNPYNLREKRRVFRFKRANSDLKREYHQTMSQLMKCVKIMQANLEELENNRGIVSVKFLEAEGIISTQQSQCFEQKDRNEDEIMSEWLMQGFEDLYGNVGIQENKDFEVLGGKNEDTSDNSDEFEGFSRAAEYDPVLFDLGVINHNLKFAVDLQALDQNVKAFRSLSSEMDKSPHVPEYELQEIQERCLYLQHVIQYWKNCLQMNHQSKATDIRRLQSIRNVWELTIQDRWVLYKDWLKTLKIKMRRVIHQKEEEYRDFAKRHEEIKQMCDFEIMQNALVVGMTTTSAAKLQTLVQALKPKIVIVEEAAEVLESHIVVSLTNKCEHVILIGDHKQLRPAPAVYKLARNYHFDISLFERMVNNGMQCHCLENQHRMRQEIAQLIAPTIYPELKNDISIYNYPSVRGVTKSLFFLTHNINEEEVNEIMSHKNSYEGDFILALCRHLILQGYKPEEITILATYKGQMFYMKERRKKYTMLNEIRITAVDNYQGEENKIILLSLVRSNAEGKIGFLSSENRVCVALSRAKEGLYVVGNMDNLQQSSSIWPKIKDVLVKQESFGTHLRLQCQIHPDQQTLVNCAMDFKKVPEGGCSLFCKVRLECGHQCESICHVNNREHKDYKCYMKCERFPVDCELLHRCPKLCYETCGKCETYVQRTLRCGHVKNLKCHINYEEYKCLEKVEVVLPNCGHTVMKPCFQDAATYPCSVPCPDRLPCGHSCTLKCHVLEDPDHLKYKCTKPCPKRNAGCTENHQCTKLCHEECGICKYEVEKKLPDCNHSLRMKCSEDPATMSCGKKCTRTMVCGHPCPRKCFEACGGCQVKVRKDIPSCGHQVYIKCCETPIQSLCKRPCGRLLSCGHGCVRKCGQECIERCHALIPCPVVPLCGHSINIPCYLSKNPNYKSPQLMQYCKYPCGKFLSCEHKCKGTCGECMQGRIHISCSEKCDRTFICGHKCKIPCAASCPPCTAKCQYKCKHSQCSNKCGMPCTPCKEQCNWNCEHLKCSKLCHEVCDRKPCYEPCKKKLKCGHECIGFCGDKCPPLCRICNKEEVTEVFFGTEDDEKARFVYLVDCKHTMESNGLEQWLQQTNNEITQKTCPRCRTPIMQTQRFMNHVKVAMKDISQVKRKVFGEARKLEIERQMLTAELLKVHGDILPISAVKMCSRKYEEMLEMCTSQLNKVSNNRRNYLSRSELQSMKSQIEIFKDLLASISIFVTKSNVNAKADVREKIFYQFDYLLEKIIQLHCKFGVQETEDFNRECKRFLMANQLAVLECSANFPYSQTQGPAKALYEKACSMLLCVEIYTEEKDAELKNVIDSLKKIIRASLTDHERKEIVGAMGFSKGHWFKCPKGHIYCIGECGGAMQESKCPECGERIGGSNHHLLASNSLASEMDGATRHAFPGGLY